MDSGAIWWIALVAGGLGCGFALVGVLVVRRPFEPGPATAGLLSGGVMLYALFNIVADYPRPDAAAYAVAFILASAGGGFALASSLLPTQARHPRTMPQAADSIARLPEDRRVGVVIAACVEPAEYDPRATAAVLEDLTDEGLLEPSIGTLPFLFFAQKTRYANIGGRSPAHSQLTTLSERLQPALGLDFRVHEWAACSGPSGLPHRIAELARSGIRRIIVVELGVAPSLHLNAAKLEVDALRLSDTGVEVRYVSAVGSGDRVTPMLVNRAMSSVEPDSTGVVLVGHGQPLERSRRNPVFDEAETVFMSRLRMLLAERGLPEDRIRIAWAEWADPDVTTEVRHLAALGCKRILVLPATYPVDTLASRLDLEIAVRQARVEEGVTAVTLPAWRDDPAVVAEIREQVLEATRLMGE